jgi:hypothetical protein
MIPPVPLVSHHHEDHCPRDLLAKRLNNQAASCIETGRYDRAVSNLVKALSLVTHQIGNTIATTTCTCKHCCLEECISFSQDKYPARRSRRQKTRGALSSTCEEDSDDEERFIYRQPIRITPQSMMQEEEGHHYMGVTLPLILSFNLALAHHLNALDSSSISLMNVLQGILKLYEIAYILHDEEKKQEQERGNNQQQAGSSSSSSIGFHMILANNLGEIHRMAGNHLKHATCLQLLLSATMYIVDCGNQNNYCSIELEGFF